MVVGEQSDDQFQVLGVNGRSFQSMLGPHRKDLYRRTRLLGDVGLFTSLSSFLVEVNRG